MTDENGRLPRHSGIAKKAGLDVGAVLLQAYTHAAEVPDKDGKLPLDLAADKHATFVVVDALLEAFPGVASETNEDAGKLHFIWLQTKPG